MIKGVLKLVRLSALPSAWADQFGGMALAVLLVGAGYYRIDVSKLPWLLLASLGVYLGGMALNDVLHVRKDRLLAKQRPIVTGQISLPAAWGVTLVLFAAGILGGALAGVVGPVLALIALTFVYNHLAAGRIVGVNVKQPKAWAAASVLVIAACRAIHVCLPLLAHTGAERLPWLIANHLIVAMFAGSVFVYFCIVTVISLFEDSGGGRRSLLAVSFLLLPVVFVLPVWLLVQPGVAPSVVLGIVVPLLLLVALLTGLWRKLDAARKQPIPPKLGACVGAGIRGEALLMAGFALMLAPAQPWWGLAALACFPASVLLSKWISPT